MRIGSILNDIAKNGMVSDRVKYYRLATFSLGSCENTGAEKLRKEARNFNQTIYKLKKQGFIKTINKDGSIFWKLTKIGLKKLEQLNDKVVVPRKKYEQKEEKYAIIVAFDIPQELTHLRKWLRYSLVGLGFEKFQKSLWIGKIKIPEEFVKDIYDLKLNNHVAIFKVLEQGLL